MPEHKTGHVGQGPLLLLGRIHPAEQQHALRVVAVERAVASQFEETQCVKLDLECRHRMIVRKGADYDCEGTTADGEEITIEIKIIDSDGRYSWADTGLDADELRQQVAAYQQRYDVPTEPLK